LYSYISIRIKTPVNMNTQSAFALFFSLAFLISACQKEAVITEEEPILVNEPRSYPNADSRLWVYFEAFEKEARLRGKNFNLVELNIQGLIEDIDVNGVAGHCKYGSHIDNEVTIDSPFWNSARAIDREFVVFHELGHCVLLRGHEESAHANGTCTSLMRSGALECRDNYSANTRTAYLNELFSEDNS